MFARCVRLTVAALAFGAFGAGTAAAEPRRHRDAALERQIREAKQQMRELEHKIRVLEAQLVRQEPPPQPAAEVARPFDACALPFFLDSSGLKRIRPECLRAAAARPCDPPFVLGLGGIKMLRPGCERDVADRNRFPR